MNYFDVKEKEGVISARVKEELERYIEDFLSSVASDISLEKVWMPWSRMFEVGIEASIQSI
jgi:hypothetical protein